MTRDQSPKLQRDSSRDRLDAARAEHWRDKFNTNKPFSQELFTPTQNISQTQSQSQPAAPFTQSLPAKLNPFKKPAEDRTAFLRAISRSPTPDRAQTPFSVRGRERGKRRERENSRSKEYNRTPSIEKPRDRDSGSQRHSQNSSQYYVTPVQWMNYSREREQHDNRGKHDDKRNYDSGAERIRSQNRYFNARYTPSCHHHHHMCDDHYYPRDRSSSQNCPSVNYTPFRQRQFSQEHNRYHTSRDFSNKQHMRQNSPYHNYGKNCSPSPYPPLQP